MSDTNDGGAAQKHQESQAKTTQIQIQSYPGNDPGPINK